MTTPPRILLWLLENLSPESRPDLKGDLLESYEVRRASGSALMANIHLLVETLSIVPLTLIIKEPSTSTSPFMILTNLKIARRNLVKDKLNTLINVVGLSLSLAACILITLFVRDELSYDQHFDNKEKIMRVGGKYGQGGQNDVTPSPATTWMLAPLMEGRVGGIELMTRMDFNELTVDVDGKEYYETGILYADSTFFDMFSLPMRSGDRATALDDAKGVVIDQATALKFFGAEDAMGKIISIFEIPFHVTGVMENIPANTHFRANIIFPMSGVLDTYPDWVRNNISGRNIFTYIRVDNSFNAATFASQVKKAVAELWPENTPSYFAQPITDIHLGAKYAGEIDVRGNRTDVYIFAVTALVILLLACINYINLTTAATLPRSREAGIKKALGSSNGMLVSQFQTESYVVLIISAGVAVALSWLLMPFLNQLTGKSLSFFLFTDPYMLGALAGTILIIGFLAGSLPALSLLRSGTIGLLNNRLHFKGPKSYFSNSLIVFQFAIATTLIACTLIVMNQIRFVRNRDIGINPHQLVMVPLQLREISARYDVLKSEMLGIPGVLSVTGSADKITSGVTGWRPYDLPGSEDAITIPTINVAHDFFETIGAEILYGRSFSQAYPADFNKSYVLNESAAKLMGKKNPVGMTLDGGAFNNATWYSMHAEVIGVVKDFHFASLHSKVEPVVFSLSSELTPLMGWMELRIESSDVTATMTALEEVWNRLAPERSFTFEFVDDALNLHYAAERQFLKIFVLFSVLSIMLGALGLFGLTDFMAKRRTKEIGIRKILGASTRGLIGLMSRDFLLLVVGANIIGWPLALYFMNDWLKGFAFQISISPWIFVATGFAAVAIAFMAILFHSLKVSRENPVNALRHE